MKDVIALRKHITGAVSRTIHGVRNSASPLGLSPREFRKYIETLREPGWTWSSYGRLWVIRNMFPTNLLSEATLHEALRWGWFRPVAKGRGVTPQHLIDHGRDVANHLRDLQRRGIEPPLRLPTWN